jgi:hypothetical protein
VQRRTGQQRGRTEATNRRLEAAMYGEAILHAVEERACPALAMAWSSWWRARPRQGCHALTSA